MQILKKWPLRILAVLLIIAACNSKPKTTTEAPMPMAPDTAKASAPVYTVAMVDNVKDPSCGMPVSAGIGDTAHYGGKVLGFCSKECKAEFMKDPKTHLAGAEMKTK